MAFSQHGHAEPSKITGAKPPLSPKHVWAVRTRLQLLKRLRDLALFNLSIDSKLRGCDLVSLKIVDVAPNGYAVDRASVRQRKTGRAVRFEITEQTRQAIDDHLSHRSEASSPYLFPGYGPASHLTTRQYCKTVRPLAHDDWPGCSKISGFLIDQSCLGSSE
jgi:integrase